MAARLSLAGALAIGLVLSLPGAGQEPETGRPEIAALAEEDVFTMPALAEALRLVEVSIAKGDHQRAVTVVERLADLFPNSGVLQAAQAPGPERENLDAEGSEKSERSLLETARRLAASAVPVTVSCPTAAERDSGSEPGTNDLKARSATPPPTRNAARVRFGRAPVREENTVWDAAIQRLRSRHSFPPRLAHAPVARRSGEPASGGLPTPVLRQLQTWSLRGVASGHVGVVYDNRDRGHSRLPPALWPQLAVTDYASEAKDAGVDYGLNTQILFDAITFGNSSTAVTGGARWRSQARKALTSPDGAARLYQLYTNDHLYVFPEHRDHDPISQGGEGDVFPANTPYMLISQGSSRSDRPFLVAVAAILAALTPETRAFLRRHRLVAPTVQMVFRRGRRGVSGRDGYMSAAAHPSVFRAEDIDLMRMIRIANALAAEDVPPMPCLEVVRESHPRPRLGYHADGVTETLFDTPSAIARAWRSIAPTRTMTVSAGATRDPNGWPLRYHWRLLRGDPERVTIVPTGNAGATAELTVGWHERKPVPGRRELTTDRVDIAVFADNGRELSAPGFVSIVFPADQRREYVELPDGTQRIDSIDYADRERTTRYVDPLVFPRRNWRDRYRYDSQGRLLGWTRERSDAPPETFTPDGYRVVESATPDGLQRAAEIAYPIRRRDDGSASVEPMPTGRTFTYMYPTLGADRAVPVLDQMPAFAD